MESHPQNPEFRNNPESFHPCYVALQCGENQISCAVSYIGLFTRNIKLHVYIHISNGTLYGPRREKTCLRGF